MKDQKIFQSDEDLNRLDYLNKTLIFISILTISHFIYTFKYSHRDTSRPVLYVTEAIIGLIILTWVLTKKITRKIIIDNSTAQFIVNYMTILKSDNYIKVPLSDINLKFDKEPNFRQPQKVTLKVLWDRKLVFEISTGDDGFSLQTLTQINDELTKTCMQKT